MKFILAMLAAAVLAGCSAGGTSCSGTACTSGGSGTVVTDVPTVTAALSSSTVTTAAPATVTATLTSSAGKAIAGNVVNFSVSATVGLLSATSALTDSSGHASVLLSPATASAVGADQVTVTSTVAGTLVTGTVGYQTSAITAAFGAFTTDVGADSSHRLSAYGQSDLTLTLTGVSSAAPAALTLTSDCVSRGKATISPATTTNTTGSATFIYQDTGGCGSQLDVDTISASITGSSVAPSTVKVYLTPPTANSITFDPNPNAPSPIYLKGSGYVESSQVRFKVVDTAGNPLPGQAVVLNLSTFAGGVLLDQQSVPETKTSDANGFVSGIVNSGTVPTPVRVIATLQGTSVSTVSSVLAIVTGLPSQLHFSLAQKAINIEGGSIDGTQNTYTVLAADRSGNPVPDGTAVIFWAEGGQIQGSSTTTTTGGISSAVANFVSQAPRPLDGRATILAYAIGEESFVDLNGNNVWDAGEPFQDLGDVVKDVQFDGIYDPANDEYVSLSLLNVAGNTQACTDSSATYPQFALGIDIPSRPNTCDATWSGRTYVRRATETVFSTSQSDLLWAGKSTTTANAGLDSNCAVVQKYFGPPTLPPYATRGTYYEVAGQGSDATWYSGSTTTTTGILNFIVGDTNSIRLNPMPAGTFVTATNASSGLVVTVLGGSPVANSPTATLAAISYSLTAPFTSGTFALTTTTPGLTATTYSITVVAGPRPTACAL